MSILEIFKEIVLPVLGFLSAFISIIMYYVKSRKRLKNAKTDEEKQAIVNDIKSKTLGLISVAESLFAEVPKSGASKLKYVLENVQTLCEENGLEFVNTDWENYVNLIVGNSNAVQDEKALEQEKATIIENIKAEIPFFIESADKLFASIPDNLSYKIEYIMKVIEETCAQKPVDVFTAFDWRSYVEQAYKTPEAV